MSMLQYGKLRTPDYDEYMVLAQLKCNLAEMMSGLEEQANREPNNKTIEEMLLFLQSHIENLNKIILSVKESR